MTVVKPIARIKSEVGSEDVIVCAIDITQQQMEVNKSNSPKLKRKSIQDDVPAIGKIIIT